MLWVGRTPLSASPGLLPCSPLNGLEASAKEVARNSAPRVEITNAWTDTVTMVVGGATYALQAGESKAFPAPAGAIAYEMRAGSHREAGTLQAGRTYTIRAPAR